MFSNRQNNQRVLLVRPCYKGMAGRFAPLATEPLELEYLARAVIDIGGEYLIWDGAVDGALAEVCGDFLPTMVAITGYFPARDRMLAHAREIKAAHPDTKIIVGGVHAELNPADFYLPEIDLVVHSGGFFTFKNILMSREGDRPTLAGISYYHNGVWHQNSQASFDPMFLPVPDRTYFHTHKQRYAYLHHGPAALVKSAFGCPHHCSFCACRLLNNGQYAPRPVEQVVAEMAGIDCELIWIVDDTFLLDVERIREFAAALARSGVNKKLIIYGRASFICDHVEILPLVKQMGVIEIIIGLEAVDDARLDSYRKGATADQNSRCVRLLQQYGIGVTGLFIMDQQARAADFKRLWQWINEHHLISYTISIFSPFPGTEEFGEYEPQLLTRDPAKWDLLSLVLPPQNLRRFGFLVRIYLLHATMIYKNPALARAAFKRWAR